MRFQGKLWVELERRGLGDGNMRDQDDRDGGGTETESNGSDIMIKGAIMGLGRY